MNTTRTGMVWYGTKCGDAKLPRLIGKAYASAASVNVTPKNNSHAAETQKIAPIIWHLRVTTIVGFDTPSISPLESRFTFTHQHDYFRVTWYKPGSRSASSGQVTHECSDTHLPPGSIPFPQRQAFQRTRPRNGTTTSQAVGTSQA